MTWFPLLLVQGDVMLRTVEVTESDKPAPDRPVRKQKTARETIVLARGEKSGHAHVVRGKGLRLYRDPVAELLVPSGLYIGTLVLSGPATLTHEEHAAIPLPANTTFLVTRQREMSARSEREASIVSD